MTTSTSTTLVSDFAAEINAAVAAGKVTKLPDAPAQGLSMRDNKQTLTKPTKAQKAAGTPTVTRKQVTHPDLKAAGYKVDDKDAMIKPAKNKDTSKHVDVTKGMKRTAPAPKAKATKPATPAAKADVITPAMIAAKYDITAKALRARMRKHADKWNKLLADGTRAKGDDYMIRNNDKNWKAIDGLMAK